MYCEADGSYFFSDPQHGRGHVPNWRPGTPGIRSNDNNRRKPYPILPVPDQLAQQGNHDYRGRKIIQHCTQKKG